MEPIIRKREEKDLKELAHNIAVIWNDTYKGIVDQDFLDGLYEHESVSYERMKEHLETQPDFYILELNNKIIGWIYFENQSEHESNAGEIHSLYVLKEYHGMGYGKLLYNFAKDKLKARGLNKIVIGCLNGNPSNDFYKHMGGVNFKTNLWRNKYLENLYLFKI